MRVTPRLLTVAIMGFAGAFFAGASGARGCPVCDSENGAEVRAALVNDDDVATNVMAAALPSLAFAGVVAVVHFGFAGRRGTDAAEERS